MAKVDIVDILRSKKMTYTEAIFDMMNIPPMNNYLLPQDIDALRKIATSARLSSNIRKKYKMIDDIMRARGFKRFSAGTNRVVYSYYEDTRFLVKIAVDRVGMQDNPMEYNNQFLLKPYVTKMFYISPCGTVGFAERVLPIKNKAEFKEIAGDVFEVLITKILGKYVVEDVGVKFFMNWGVRVGMGPVLLDYPYVYKLDGKKLYCTKMNPITNIPCNGEIDYDQGFNHLVCTSCGKVYLASDLRDNKGDNKFIIKGGTQMKVVLKKGDTLLTGIPVETEEVMAPPKPKRYYNEDNSFVVAVTKGDEVTFKSNDEKPNARKRDSMGRFAPKEEMSTKTDNTLSVGILKGSTVIESSEDNTKKKKEKKSSTLPKEKRDKVNEKISNAAKQAADNIDYEENIDSQSDIEVETSVEVENRITDKDPGIDNIESNTDPIGIDEKDSADKLAEEFEDKYEDSKRKTSYKGTKKYGNSRDAVRVVAGSGRKKNGSVKSGFIPPEE